MWMLAQGMYVLLQGCQLQLSGTQICHIPGVHPQMIQVPAAMLIPFPYEVTASASISNAQIPHSFLNPFIFAFYFVKGLQFLLNMKLQLIRFPGW